jgi:hypothetical protein
MNPFIFMLARAYSTQTPMSVRYKEHAQYLEKVLTEPTSRVERSIEQYFREREEEILSRLPSVAFLRLDPTGQIAYRDDLVKLWSEHNWAADGKNPDLPLISRSDQHATAKTVVREFARAYEQGCPICGD